MPRTLGINDDYWHGIIPFVVQLVAYPLLLKFYPFYAPVGIVIVSLVLWLLQAMNEWTQAVDHDVAIKYGCYENFQYNSRFDMKMFFIGWMLGLFVGSVVGGIWSAM